MQVVCLKIFLKAFVLMTSVKLHATTVNAEQFGRHNLITPAGVHLDFHTLISHLFVKVRVNAGAETSVLL